MFRSSLAPPTDRDLVARIGDGDVRSFEAVYDRYSSQVFSLAVHVTGRRRAAEEVTQDAFLTLWRSPERYDANRGTLKTWLLAIVRHRSIDWLRRERRHDRGLAIDEWLTDHVEASERTDEQVLARDQAVQTHRLVRGLPSQQRQVIELAFFKGLTQVEIANQVGIPLGTVKGRQRLAMTKMHRELVASSPSAAV